MSTEFERDMLAEAHDLGYEGDDLIEAVLLLCLDNYDDERVRINDTETACLIHRWLVLLCDDEGHADDDAGAMVLSFATPDAARNHFDAAIRKEVKS